MPKRIRTALVAILVGLGMGCAVVPASYVPTTGKIGSRSGEACVWKLFGIIPFSDENVLLEKALNAADNPTKDVAVINKIRSFIIVTQFCVNVRGD